MRVSISFLFSASAFCLQFCSRASFCQSFDEVIAVFAASSSRTPNAFSFFIHIQIARFYYGAHLAMESRLRHPHTMELHNGSSDVIGSNKYTKRA
jgi:hypothetical protein